jgi:hypothetical protein
MATTSQRLAALAGTWALLAASTFGLTVAPVEASDRAGSLSVTKEGSGDFSGLKVSVSQTKNLVDQVVRVSWQGGEVTRPGSGIYSINYLQIMQCWSDDGERPDREQCQYGGLIGDGRGGAFSTSRQVTYGSSVVDPIEPIKADPGSITDKFVPFRSVTGKTETGAYSEFFDANTTNEVPFAVTRSDGTGESYFSVQTVRDAPGLGCGEPVGSGTSLRGRSCWLVVVPRDDREVNGAKITNPTSNALRSSPLSASNWQHRIEFPLEFEAVGKPCPLGREERLTVGHELVAEAITRWQPALCSDGGPVFGYSQVSDDLARRQLSSTDAALGFVSGSGDASEAVYAPVASSAIVVGFNIERQSLVLADESIKSRDGERITSLKLTPRLVAKLITQTYRRGADFQAPSVADNPTDMSKDQEFIELNPTFNDLVVNLPDALMPVGRADITKQVWEWLRADPDAKAFLDGKPDPWGTKVNPAFGEVTLPREDFPKPEPFCRTYDDGRPDLCALDLHPYAASMQESAKAASRGDTLSRGVWDPLAIPPAWKKGGNQPSGTRAVLAITDAASAARFGLEVAEVRNGAKRFVKPSTASIQAAIKQFTPEKGTGVLAPASKVTGDAYPLAAVSYAAVPTEFTPAAAREYGALLNYAVGDGQVPGLTPGTLPEGYAPLSDDLREQTRAIAASLVRGESPEAPGDQDSEAPGDEGSTTADGTDFGGTAGAPTAAGAQGLDGGVAVDGSADETGVTDTQTVAFVTAADVAGVGRLVPLLAATLAVLCCVAGPLLIVLSRSAPGRRGASGMAATNL